MVATYRRRVAPTTGAAASAERAKLSGSRTSAASTTTAPSTKYASHKEGEEPLLRWILTSSDGAESSAAIPDNDTLLALLRSCTGSEIVKGWAGEQNTHGDAAKTMPGASGQALVRSALQLAHILERAIQERNGDQLVQRLAGYMKLEETLMMTEKSAAICSRFRVLPAFLKLAVTRSDFRSILADLGEILKRIVSLADPSFTTKEKERKSNPDDEFGADEEEEALDEQHQMSLSDLEAIAELEERVAATARQIDLLRRSSGQNLKTVHQSKSEYLENRSKANKTNYEEISSGSSTDNNNYRHSPPTLPSSSASSADYSQARDGIVKDVLMLLDRISSNGHYKAVLEEMAGLVLAFVQNVKSNGSGDPLAKGLEEDAMTLLGRIANNQSASNHPQRMLEAARQIAENANKHYELGELCREWFQLIRDRLNLGLEAVKVSVKESQETSRRWMERGACLMDRLCQVAIQEKATKEKAKDKDFYSREDEQQRQVLVSPFVRMCKSFEGICEGIGEDWLWSELVEWGEGVPSFHPSMVADGRDVFLPALIKSVYQVTVPTLAVEEGFALQGLTLPATLLTPTEVVVGTEGSLAGPPNAPWRTGGSLRARGMHGEIRGVRFTLNRTAFPSFSDEGRLAMRIGGVTLFVQLAAQSDTSNNRYAANSNRSCYSWDGSDVVVVEVVRVRVDRVKISFKTCRHPFWMALARPLLQARVKAAIERDLCDRIRSTLSNVLALLSL